ncbi:MAG TPA: AAA family ATPase [Thermomicrobiaceae bacterium]|nr:AAA family ATPase [Thermomicrobiaceae bacterium]
MSTPSSGTEHPGRLADRLAAARRGRFVGRLAELELVRSALLGVEPSFAVLCIRGPGGVGKTALLREYARLAAEAGRPVVRVDGRDVDPSPPGFLRALGQAIGPADEPSSPLARSPPRGLLLIDTYETLTPLDDWLRERFLPQLPVESLVVLAGRTPPRPAWRTDLDWAGLVHLLPLGNLRPEESRTYLAARGIPEAHHAGLLAFTHGHPLALALVADVLSRGESVGAFGPVSEPDVVRILLERLARDVPSAAPWTAQGRRGAALPALLDAPAGSSGRVTGAQPDRHQLLHPVDHPAPAGLELHRHRRAGVPRTALYQYSDAALARGRFRGGGAALRRLRARLAP